MARAGNWSSRKTFWVTLFCGMGHVGASLILAFVGVFLGVAAAGMALIDAARERLALGVLIGFGLVYFIWGLRRAARSVKHDHWHSHEDGTAHRHPHDHEGTHQHVHSGDGFSRIGPWVLFTALIFGPCEPLIPVLFYPAVLGHFLDLFLAAGVFSLATVGTMLLLVLGGQMGFSRFSLGRLEPYRHAVSGGALSLCGILGYLFTL